MKTVYVDSEFKCHTTNMYGTFREIKTDFFDGKCDTYIEGYRFVPDGESWTREDGKTFQGEMIAPWKDYNLLEAAQEQYEADLAKAAQYYQEGVESV